MANLISRTQIFSDLFLHFYLVSHDSLNIAHSNQPTNPLGHFFPYILKSCAMRIIVNLCFRALSVVTQKLHKKNAALRFCSVKIPGRETRTSTISIQHYGLPGPQHTLYVWLQLNRQPCFLSMQGVRSPTHSWEKGGGKWSYTSRGCSSWTFPWLPYRECECVYVQWSNSHQRIGKVV